MANNQKIDKIRMQFASEVITILEVHTSGQVTAESALEGIMMLCMMEAVKKLRREGDEAEAKKMELKYELI